MYLTNFIHKKSCERMKTQLFCDIVTSIVNRIHKHNHVEFDDILVLTKSAIGMEYRFIETGLITNINDAIAWAMMNVDPKTKQKIKWKSNII